MDLSFLVTDDTALRGILRAARVIAMLGASNDPARPSHGVFAYLHRVGYHVVPVTPTAPTVLGVPSVASLAAIQGPIDIVDVFRRPADVDVHADEAIAVGAKVLWLQLGVIAPAAARRAHDAGLQVVMDRCLLVEHRRLLG